MDLKFPDSIWWPKLTVTWFCIMDEGSASPGDVAKRRRASVHFRQLVTTRPRADWSGRSSLGFLSPIERSVEGISMGASFPLLPEFTLSPFSVFPPSPCPRTHLPLPHLCSSSRELDREADTRFWNWDSRSCWQKPRVVGEWEARMKGKL